MVPHRVGRYGVKWQEFPGNVFPSFAMGSFYIMSREAVTALFSQLGKQGGPEDLLFLEDVAITGQLRERAGLRLVNAWTLIKTGLYMGKEGGKERRRAEAEALRSVVVFLQDDREDEQEKAAWVWAEVWGKPYTQIQGQGEGYWQSPASQ